MTESRDCGDYIDLLVESATGAATGDERARLMRHLAECGDCRRSLAELSAVADEVLLVAPERQPPVGFESAVMARIEGTGAAEPKRKARPARRRVSLALAGAAAALAIGLGSAWGVWGATADDRRIAESYRETLEAANGRYFTAAPVLDAEEAQVGHVFAYQGEPSWVFVVLDGVGESGDWEVVLDARDWSGTIATCEVDTDECGVGVTITEDLANIERIDLVSPRGETFSAEFAWG